MEIIHRSQKLVNRQKISHSVKYTKIQELFSFSSQAMQKRMESSTTKKIEEHQFKASSND